MKASVSLALAAASIASLASATALAQAPYRYVFDDFHEGFTVGPVASSAHWFYQAVTGPTGSITYNDGATSTDHHGLHVLPLGTNPRTHEPAFTLTVGQEGAPDNHVGLPGDLDHPKWLVYENHLSSVGTPGFDLVPGQEFACEAVMSGQTYGTEANPFYNHILDADADPRLASYAFNAVDFESFIVADFFVTNEQIYVLYERLPFARSATDNYASFTHTIPVGRVRPGEEHRYTLAFNKTAGTIRWLVDRREVFRVDHIGQYLDRRFVTIDRGGTPENISPRSIDCGIGTFTLLDGYRPGDVGLVKLTGAAGYYVNPDLGEPFAAHFLDPLSLPHDRLWGQGARLDVNRMIVMSRDVHGPDWDQIAED